MPIAYPTITTPTKTSPVGIDIPIEALRSELSTILLDRWSVSDYKSFGRCYRNLTQDGKFRPEVFVSGKDYKDVLPIDTISAMSYFVEGGDSRRVSGGIYSQPVDLIFFVNLKTTYPTITHRSDEECHNDVVGIIERQRKITINDIQVGIDKVFSGYEYSEREFADMHPYHVFKIGLNVTYNLIKQYC